MNRRHYDAIMSKMPETCCDNDCRDTNWGGKGRAHNVQPTCPMFLLELRKLEQQDQWDFTDARKALPRNSLNTQIKFVTGQVTMPLEAFLAIAKHFEGTITYGLEQTHGGEGGADSKVYELWGMPYNDARDLAEVSGKQLMQKFESGWMEA